MMVLIEPIPNSPQRRLLRSSVREVGFGGQAGGSKSYGLLLDVLSQIHKPKYDAILFRRTYKRLKEAGGLIDLSHEIYPNLHAKYNKSDYTWTFPNSNTIRFSHIENDKDVDQFSGSQYPYIGIDELQEFPERVYLFLFSRNRSTNSDVDLYMRSTFNPGNVGHHWIKKRFIEPFVNYNKPKWFKRVDGIDTETDSSDKMALSRLFIPSRLEDNPYLWNNGDSDYERSLHQLDTVDFKRLRLGDWDVKRSGLVYHGFSEPGPDSRDIDLNNATGLYHSHDFGAVNHVWGIWAKIGEKFYLIYSEKLQEGTTQARADYINKKLAKYNIPVIAGYGGAGSEKQQRIDFIQAGLKIRLPGKKKVRQSDEKGVEHQIDIANKMLQNGDLVICSNQLQVIDQLDNCVRDDKEGIVDKATWHYLDMIRYMAAGINKGGWTRGA